MCIRDRACAPSQRLYVSWPRTADGEDKEPSELVTALMGIFPTLRPLRDLPDVYFANSKDCLLYTYRCV